MIADSVVRLSDFGNLDLANQAIGPVQASSDVSVQVDALDHDELVLPTQNAEGFFMDLSVYADNVDFEIPLVCTGQYGSR